MAVTCTICAQYPKLGVPAGTVQAGAVYAPAGEMLPWSGLTDQFTAVFVAPEIVAVNWTVCDPVIVTIVGATPTTTEVAVAVFPNDAVLVETGPIDAARLSSALAKPTLIDKAGPNNEAPAAHAIQRLNRAPERWECLKPSSPSSKFASLKSQHSAQSFFGLLPLSLFLRTIQPNELQARLREVLSKTVYVSQSQFRCRARNLPPGCER